VLLRSGEVPVHLGSVTKENWSEPFRVLFVCYFVYYVVYLPTYLLYYTSKYLIYVKGAFESTYLETLYSAGDKHFNKC
jgi:hypothetical protein